MRAKDIVVGKKYHLKTAPAFPWIKVLEVIPPKTGLNTNNYIVVKCVHSSSGWSDVGIIRHFRPKDIIKVNQTNK